MNTLIYILLCLIWGSTWLAIKYGLADAPPLWSVAIRFSIAALIMLVINGLRKAEYPRSIREILKISSPGLLIYAFPYWMVYQSEMYISSALTAVLFASFPFFVAGYSLFLLKKERPNIYHWAGLAVGFGGVIIIFYDSLIISEFMFLGAVLAVGSSAISAMGTVILRARFHENDFAIMAGLQIAAGALISIPVAAFFEPLSLFKITSKSVGALLYLSIFGSVIAFLGYYWLLKKIRTLDLSLITFITPIIATVLGYFFLAETFSTFTAFGSILILGGMILVLKK